jgi:hypothetical protein
MDPRRKEGRTMRYVQSRWLAGSAAVLALLMLTMVAPSKALATDAEVRAGVYPDADAVAVGGGVLTQMGPGSQWYFNPNIELALGDRRDIVAMSGDFHYDFATNGPAFWMGGGPAVLVLDREGPGGSETDLGVNVLTGVGAKRGNVRPFGQVRGTVADHSQVTIAGGVRF